MISMAAFPLLKNRASKTRKHVFLLWNQGENGLQTAQEGRNLVVLSLSAPG
jgi:hypothetical protein